MVLEQANTVAELSDNALSPIENGEEATEEAKSSPELN